MMQISVMRPAYRRHRSPIAGSTRPAAVGAALALVLAACGTEDPTEPMAATVRGIAVLNGFGRPGVTTLDTTLALASFVDLGSSMDALTFTVKGDTVAAASSKGQGDKLFIVDLATTTARTVQLPAGSNPSGVEFLPGTGAARFGVALRDLGEVADVTVPSGGGAPTVTRITGAGLCPNDVVFASGGLWSLDANARCATDYVELGPVRLIRVLSTAGRDTISLGDRVWGSGATATVHAGYVFVAAPGVANFATGQVTVPGAVAKVAASTGEVVSVLSLPAGTWGGSMRVGLDGRLYVAAYENLTTFDLRVFAVDVESMTFAGTRAAGRQHLRLVKASGAEASCAAAVGDADGNVYCAENGAASAARVYFFNAEGDEVRSGSAGQGAVDIALLR